MKIATTSICKNEIKYVQSWYDALKNEVDYITVLDTGSTDGTFEALKKLAKKDSKITVKKKIIDPWSFADARNEAMKLLPKDTDVFISIDLDETFKPGFGQAIKDNWTDDCLQMTYKYAWNHNPDGSPLHTFTYSKICRNDGNWEWKYPIHECLIRTGEQKTYTTSALVNMTDKILLDHWQDKTVNRDNYLDLLKVRWEQYQGDMDAVYYARECVFHKLFEEAIRIFNVIIQKREKNEEINLRIWEISYVHYMTGLSYYQLGKAEEAKKLILKAIEIYPAYRDPYIDLTKIYMAENLFAQAEYTLRKCLSTTYRHFEWVEVSDVWGVVPYDFLAVSAYNCGDKKTALIAISKAIVLSPDNEKLKENYVKILNSIEDKDI